MAPMMISPETSDGWEGSPSVQTPPSSPGSSEPIAICGFAFQLPGDSTSPQKFWDLLSKGRSAQCDVPASRFNIDGFYHPQGMERPGSMTTRGGYFLGEDVRQFENAFFGINNLEAAHMDPQQRKLLEVVFQCLENAGVPLDHASGSNTGCYVGNFTFDFLTMQVKESDYMHHYSATGFGTTILSNRISHVFNLLGPSIVLDTACSSSLYCLHVACTALENHDCDAAIVAGANLIQSAEQHIATMKAGVLSPTSACHTFDTSADGYGRGDGIGALYIKRLSDALRDGDPIRSVVRSSAINANGKTSGISLPSADGQEMVIRKAMAKGGVCPDDVSFIECHGTGTKVGDAIELDALSRVFKRRSENPLLIGAVKSNVGHSEAASGITSVVKTTLALERGQIPPTHGLKNINPKLKVEERNFQIPTELTPWPKHTSPVRRIGINSFGYGGANAHVILEEAPAALRRSAPTESDKLLLGQSSVVLPLSAFTSASLETRMADLAAWDFTNIRLSDLAHTLGSRRTHFPVRGFVIADSREPVSEAFKTEAVVASNSVPATADSIPFAFVFTGQGSQWPGMCAELFEEFPIFNNAIKEMDTVLQSLPHPPSWSLRDAILDKKDPDLIHLPERSQPCCTAVQIALVQLLASWGIMPDATAGHSSGEIAAAFASGHISAAEAIVAAYYRGYCVSQSTTGLDGAMMAVGASESDMALEISNHQLQDQLRVACINSPEGVTVSGDSCALDKLLASLQAKGTFARKLKTGGQAYHSHHMTAIGAEYERLLDQVLPTLDLSIRMPRRAQLVSSVTGMDKSSGFGPSYWRGNLESQVRFSEAIEVIGKKSEYCFVEVGPHSSLELPIKQTLAKSGGSSSPIKYGAPIKRNTDALQSALSFAGSLWLQGCPINWAKVNGLESSFKSSRPLYRVVTDLPPYRFNYESLLWTECRASSEYRLRKYPRHELLGSLIPGGSHRDFIFRNLLRLDDVSWLKDHKIEETVVFPGSGYMAMAMEAVMQASDVDRARKPSFRFSNINITNALTIDKGAQEVFTSIHKSNISKTSTSATWWDFNISTYSEGTSIFHASGSITVSEDKTMLSSKYESPKGSLEASAKRTWYEKLVKSGLNYGPTFQSITNFSTPRMKSGLACSADVPLLTASGDPTTVYPVHPITLDAMIQLAFVAATEGIPKRIRARVPTRFSSVVINTSTETSGIDAQMNSVVRKTGFGSIDTGLELITAEQGVVAQFDSLKLTPYQAATSHEDEDRRHPVLRSLWKPDVFGVGFMDSEAANQYSERFADEANSPVSDRGLLKLGAMLDLFAHKNPRARILEVGSGSQDLTVAILELLGFKTDFKRISTYHTAEFNDSGALIGGPIDLETGDRCEKSTAVEAGSFDLVLVPSSQSWDEARIEIIKSTMADDAAMLVYGGESARSIVGSEDLSSYSFAAGNEKIIAVARQTKNSVSHVPRKRGFLIVEREESSLGLALANALESLNCGSVPRVRLHDLTEEHVPAGMAVINLCEIYSPLLSVISDDEMTRVKMMTDRAASLLWVTGGNITQGQRPDFGLVFGLSRAIVLEQPSLKFYVYDIDEIDVKDEITAQNLIAVLSQPSFNPDLEFVQKDGVVHVSRFTPDDGVNAQFRSKQGLETSSLRLAEVGDARLSIERPGQFDTVFFKQQEAPTAIAATDVRIKVASAGVNAKDYYVLAGRVDTLNATCQLECAGTIEAVGSGVTEFAVGDRVVAMAPMHFQTYQTLPHWACHKLIETERFDTCSTLPLVYATAIYALQHRAMIKAGETILVHSGAGGVGLAAIQIALNAGAEVFTTVSTEEKKTYLVERFGLKPSNIFSSRGVSFLDDVLKATDGRGVDVILNSLTGDQLHATWRCAAEFGRFVEIGKLDLSTAGRLEMDQFLKNTTFTAFDLSDLYNTQNEQHHRLWNSLLCEVMTLYRLGKITAIEPLKVFDIAEATQAFRYFSSRSRMGKIAIDLTNPESAIRVQKLKHTSRFDPDKSFVMVGCLGGLGRTLSRWMVSRGARKFAFLGRSGIEKPAARSLVQDLEAMGAVCEVVKGDVCKEGDVAAVVAAGAKLGNIGGVVQAAMGLNEAIFSNMPNNYWHTGIDPKVQGTWHLYNSLRTCGQDSQLDFFLMTSSVSGSVGTATEGNYCAGNHFLDLFARHLRGKGVPGVSVGLGMISEVGYLHENPEIEALLLRKGIQTIDADELIQLIDLALCSGSSMGIHHAYDELAASHLLTGLEVSGMKELRKRGFEGNHPVMDDARAGLLASALDGGLGGGVAHAQAGDLPAEVIKGMEAGASLEEAVLDHIRRRFGNLVLMKYEKVDVKKPLAEYGMDSMIGAEFRTWLYQNFAVEVPLLILLNKTCTLESLRDKALAEKESE